MFEEERPALTPLPLMRFASFKDLVRTVCDDTTVRVDNSNYAARPAAIGAKALVRRMRSANPPCRAIAVRCRLYAAIANFGEGTLGCAGARQL